MLVCPDEPLLLLLLLDDDELLLDDDVPPPPAALPLPAPACEAASDAHAAGVATPTIFIALSMLVAIIVHCAVCLPADAHELVDCFCDVFIAVHAATAHAQSSARAIEGCHHAIASAQAREESCRHLSTVITTRLAGAN